MHSKVVTNDSANKIFYWNGILDPLGLTASYDDIIKKMLDGDWTNLDLEKLHGHNVYSVRINKSDRLLFTTIVVNDQPYLMLLDEVLNHDYAKSRFLKPAVLKNYLELHGKAISEKLIHQHFNKIQDDTLLLPKQTNSSIEYARIDFYQQKFIELDETQLGAATTQSMPLIISGAPGSGKSCIALTILGQYIKTNVLNEFPILYITESRKLASSLERAWLELPIAQNLDAGAVQFKSYQELIEELTNEPQAFVDKGHCITWLASHIKQTRKLPNQTINNEDFFIDIDLMYQELRIISGCPNFDMYSKLGKKQSLFHNAPNEQTWLFEAYAKYQEHLEDIKAIHAPFYPLKKRDQFKLIVVDEAQDLSHLQLETLANLACNKQICFCEDNRQSLSDNKSKIPYLKNLMHSWGKKENQITLTTSYRCPEAVITMANAVASLKSMATGHGQQDIVLPVGQTAKGTVKWLDKLPEHELTTLQNAAASPDFAIITSKEYKEEARQLFGTPLVFTADEIKGLEYKNILAWRLFDDPLFKAADKLIGDQSSGFNKKAGHHAKENQGNELYGPPLNAIYTAFTRTTDTLYIFQKKHHYLPNIIARLTDAMPKQSILANTTTTTSTTSTNKSNMADWFVQVKMQLGLGNEHIAKDIYINILKKSEQEFDVFKIPFINPASTNKETDETAIVMPVTSTLPEPIEQLIALIDNDKITENILCSFLNNTKAREYLFDTPLTDYSSLFSQIIFSPEGMRALLSCMAMPRFKRIFEPLPEHAFCHPAPKTLGFPDMTPLWLISRTPADLAQFEFLLGKMPTIANAITAQALCLPVHSEALNVSNTTPLYQLSDNYPGNCVLEILLAKNPKLAKGISVEALCLAINTTEEKKKNTSPLYYLAISTSSMKILKTLFINNPRLAKDIKASGLCLQDSSSQSPLYFLSSCNAGIEILEILLTENPNLFASDAIGHTMCQPLPADNVALPNTSPFYLLASLIQGRKLLKKWLANPESAKYVNAQTLCIPVNVNIQNNISALYWLAYHEDGLDLLETLLVNNPEIAKHISSEDLNRACQSTDEDYYNTSPQSLLYGTEHGRKILDILSCQNPELGKIINLYKLHQSQRSTNSFFSGSPVQKIAPVNAKTSEYASTLSKLPEPVEKLLKKVTETTLCSFLKNKKAREYLFNTEIKENSCLFTILCYTTEGRNALLYCMNLKHFKKFFEPLPEYAFCKPAPLTSDIPNISPLWLIAKNSENDLRKFLSLLGKIPTIAKSITAGALWLPLPEDVKDEGNTSPMYYLSANAVGLDILKFLFENNPGLAENISSQDLCLPVKKYKKTILSMLLSSAPGRKILDMLCSKNPALTELVKQEGRNNSQPSTSGLFSESGSASPNPELLEAAETNLSTGL